MPCKLARSSVEQAKEASSSHFLHLFQPSLASVLPPVQCFHTSVVNSEFGASSIIPAPILPPLLLLPLLLSLLLTSPSPSSLPQHIPGFAAGRNLSNMYHYGGQHQQHQSYYGAARGAADDDAAPGPCCYFHPSEVVVGVCAVCLRERLLVLAAKQSGSSGRSGRGSMGGGVSGSCHLRPFSRARRGGSGGGSSRGKVISMISIPKVFALGSFLGGGGGGSRTDARRGRKKAAAAAAVDDPDEESISSLEDSFISIKFGTDGRASWDSKKTAAAGAANPALKAKYIPSTLLPPTSGGFQSQHYPSTTCAVDDDQSSSQRLSVVEHHKSRSSPLRWRKRIAHLLHLIRWRRSSSGGNTSRTAAGGAAAQGCKADAAVAVVGKVPRRSGWMRSLTRRRSADRLA